jgi:hypothetical protein
LKALLALLLLPLLASGATTLAPGSYALPNGTTLVIPALPPPPTCVPPQTLVNNLCTTPIVSTTVPTSGATYWIYKNGVWAWGSPGCTQANQCDWNSNATSSYQDTTGKPPNGTLDVMTQVTAAWGEWQPHFDGATPATMDVSAYSTLVFLLKPTLSNQTWKLYTMAMTNAQGGDTALPAQYTIMDLTPYTYPVPNTPAKAGVWQAYSVPLPVIGVGPGLPGGTKLYKLAWQDNEGLASNTFYAADIALTNKAAVTSSVRVH